MPDMTLTDLLKNVSTQLQAKKVTPEEGKEYADMVSSLFEAWGKDEIGAHLIDVFMVLHDRDADMAHRIMHMIHKHVYGSILDIV